MFVVNNLIITGMYNKLKIKESISFIKNFGNSIIETICVRHRRNIISVYLSSHNGSRRETGWLTVSDQSKITNVEPDLYNDQLRTVLNYVNAGIQNRNNILNDKTRVDINFMAYGEPLANKFILNNYAEVSTDLDSIVKSYGYSDTRINISTMLPLVCYGGILSENALISSFCNRNVLLKPRIYYSLYSLSDDFRKNWIPLALPWQIGLVMLKEYQYVSDMPITIHFPLIKNNNDERHDYHSMASILEGFRFNKLRLETFEYNYDDSNGNYSAPDDIIEDASSIVNYTLKPKFSNDYILNPYFSSTRQRIESERGGYMPASYLD